MEKTIEIPEGYEAIIEGNKVIIEQKPAEWSEEDEKMIEFWNLYYEHKVGDWSNKDVVENLEKFRDWLKSLKERVQPQQEWSEEDEVKYIAILKALDDCESEWNSDWTEEKNWLSSLKGRVQPHLTWKPSDEQMELLREVQQALLGKDCHNRFVNFMYELKKLKG